ncbi:DUF2225 domain-containing protein [Tepidibacillus sp. HK-1]|uniref:DUF2225 domain-containing protein n=1 Tax=Tepidibacillus sp. HK-1 TaxID=1883407 RepID=UPI000852C7A4|nr:DUF2225 domain-containing protein [Tepidibacillus sp. HK-1]GBF12115.1 hypothetical protein HK1_02176 [Tepidibacillus sp. HK-1]
MDEVFYEKKVKCLYCKEDFKTLKMRQSKTKVIKRDADYCPYYEGVNPLFYEVNVCPHCGFAFTDSFSPIRELKNNRIKQDYIDKIQVPQLCKKRSIQDAIYCYKLALYTATILEEQNFIIANLCMRIAWINRYLQNKEEELRFLKNALDTYYEIYETEDLDKIPMDKYTFIYLIGELQGRLGDYEKMRRWFSMIFEDKNVTPKILKMARDRWNEYKEMELNN